MPHKSPADPKPWSILASKRLVDREWLKVREEHVRLANGAEMEDYYILDYTDWVNALLVTPDDLAILIRIYRHGLGEVHTELPGGCIDPGETPEQAAARECLEETGYAAESWQRLGVCCANPATHSNRTYLFLGRGACKVQSAATEETEEIVLRPTPLAELPAVLDSGEVISASHALALHRACRELGL